MPSIMLGNVSGTKNSAMQRRKGEYSRARFYSNENNKNGMERRTTNKTKEEHKVKSAITKSCLDYFSVTSFRLGLKITEKERS